MARPLRISFPGAFYHITSRGNEKKKIFRDLNDRNKFTSYLESATVRYGAAIHAYCLMNNHYHILLETPSGNLSQIMHHINGAYTTYFNIKYQRAGHLFQGRFKAILVEKDEYAKELSRYVHLNPVRAKIVDQPEDYPWSSYQFYAGLKKFPHWLKYDFILGYFSNGHSDAQRNYRAYVEVLINKVYESPLKGVAGSTILGSEKFVERIQARYISDKIFDSNVPALRELSQRPSIEEIREKVETFFEKEKALGRGVMIYLCYKYTGKRLREIGENFGIGDSGVSQASRRISMRIDRDRNLKRKVEKIEKRLGLSRMKT